MKQLFIGICLGLIASIWIFYFFFNRSSFPVAVVAGLTPTPSVMLTTAPTLDQAVLIDQIKQAFSQKDSISLSKINLTVKSQDDSHALGSVSFTGEPALGWWLAAKVNGVWKLVQDGNGSYSCELTDAYHFPVSMVPSCVDKNGNLITFQP